MATTLSCMILALSRSTTIWFSFKNIQKLLAAAFWNFCIKDLIETSKTVKQYYLVASVILWKRCLCNERGIYKEEY